MLLQHLLDFADVTFKRFNNRDGARADIELASKVAFNGVKLLGV